jgi:hypothetical protein
MRAITLIAIFALACDNNNNKKSTCSGAGLDQSPACIACIQQSCNAQATSCFGPGWAGGDFTGGMCDAYFACACKCASGDKGCLQNCMPFQTGGCEPCFYIGVERCAATNCRSECSFPGDGGATD